jgi:hypothetical protein
MERIEQLRQQAENLLWGADADQQVALLIALSSTALLLWLVGVLRIRRSTEYLLSVLDESTPERMRITALPWRGFDAEIPSPADPFWRLFVEYRSPLVFSPVDAFAALVGRHQGTLIIRARFKEMPRSELAWVQGGVPGQALSKDANVSAWIHRRMAIINSEYATRGNQVERLSRTFTEFQARFSPAIRRVCIQAEMENELEVVVSMHTLSARAIPHLMASVWSLGQAAM